MQCPEELFPNLVDHSVVAVADGIGVSIDLIKDFEGNHESTFIVHSHVQ